MAARLNPRHQDDVRRKIQASQIINRLQAYFRGEIELTQGQVQTAKILLDKSVSNAPTEVQASGDIRIVHAVE